MNTYKVTMRAIITKTFTVASDNLGDATAQAEKLFRLDRTGADQHQFVHETVKLVKKFVCYWGEGYGGEDHAVTHDTNFFCEDVGYEADDIEEINALEVGQSWRSGYPNGDHFVTRVA
jgi:hypothetical protein